MYTTFAVALFAVTVNVSFAIVELVAVYGVARSVVTPAASLGVIVKVAVSPAATVAVVALSENDAGAPATVHVTFVEDDRGPADESSSVVPSRSVQTLYEIVARPAVRDSPEIGRTTPEVPVST
jgi:hypothetical protein